MRYYTVVSHMWSNTEITLAEIKETIDQNKA